MPGGLRCVLCLFVFAFSQSGQDLKSWLVLGSQALETGDNAGAEASFRKALTVEPNSIEVLNDLGIALARQNNEPEAIEFYQRALRIQPGHAATKKNLAIAYFREQRYAAAWPLLKTLSAKLDDFQTLDLAGVTLFALDRYAESAAYLERASKLNPTDMAVLDLLGKAYMRTGNHQGTADVFARMMRLDPNSPAAHVMMGLAYDNMFRNA